MSGLLLSLAIFLLIASLWLFWRAQQQRRETGLPAGEIIYADASNWRQSERPLFSQRYLLTGKPDYLVETGGEIIPVEVKSTHLSGDKPYRSHALQLAAYCLLVEESYGHRPSYGIIQYANKTIRLPFSDSLRQELFDMMQAIRSARSASLVRRNHDDPKRCVRCGFRHACGEPIAL
ncbi:MAG: CRISPR-associated protein Cas4 [Chloroflexi bacterium]|nr:CRISPR-associated protein Cas4 [Chloroflexota bacterium]